MFTFRRRQICHRGPKSILGGNLNKKSKETGILIQCGLNLMSFVLNMGVWGVKLEIFLHATLHFCCRVFPSTHPHAKKGFLPPCSGGLKGILSLKIKLILNENLGKNIKIVL